MSTPFPPSSPAQAHAPASPTRTRQACPQPARSQSPNALAAAALWTIALSAAPLHALAAETAPGELGLPHRHADPPRTVAVWLFDEPPGLYPSAVIGDVGPDDVLMVIGPGGRITTGGRFGNALQVLAEPVRPEIPAGEHPAHFGLVELPVPDGRTVEPMSWFESRAGTPENTSADTAAPPTPRRRSNTTTSSPARASTQAATRPLCPPPTITTSACVGVAICPHTFHAHEPQGGEGARYHPASAGSGNRR